jgi:hypothetical protein
MADQDMDRQVREAFERSPVSAAADNPCAVYLASAADASCLGDAIERHFGGQAKAFYDALVQIAASTCKGAGGSAR